MFHQLAVLATKVIPTGLPVPVIKGPLRGARWIAGAAPGEGKGLSIVANLCEPQMLEKARQLAAPEGICFDIGANVGLYTLLFSRYAKHVFAFEPSPRNISFLSRTLAWNRVGNATIVPSAVAESTCLSSFNEGANCALGRLDPSGLQPVSTVSCDDFSTTYGVIPSLLKIDVEGSELSVLKGAAGLLEKYGPSILLSTHGNLQREQCLMYLDDLKYHNIVPLDHTDPEQATEFVAISSQPLPTIGDACDKVEPSLPEADAT